MPILFNQSNSTSLLKFIKDEVAKVKSSKRGEWIFYIITCYFNPQIAKKLIADIKKILDSQLTEIHILIDIHEWLKQCVDRHDFVNQISKITNLPNSSISFIPISYDSKLFHAKSYALINSEISPITNTNNGFAIVTSGNLTKSGFKDNIEIGQVIRDPSSLSEFIKIFSLLKNNYFVSNEKEAEQREFQLAVQFLSKGKFYHIWHPSFDLTFRLTLSPEEKKRLHNLTDNEETKRKLEDFAIKEIEIITNKLVDIQSIFKIHPKPIPKDLWGMYSIDTLLGQWVPFEISKLIDEELKESMKIFKPIFQEIGSDEKLKEYSQYLEDYIDRKLKENVIDLDRNNVFAVEAWTKRVKRFFADENILKVFVCKYEKNNLVINNIERDLVIAVYQRIKDFYYESDKHKGLGKKIAELSNDSNIFESLENDKTYWKEISSNLAKKAKISLERNRLGELYKLINGEYKAIKKGESFIAFKILNINDVIGYERLEGIFIGFDKEEDISKSSLTYKTKDGLEEKILVNELKTFQKYSEKDNSKKN